MNPGYSELLLDLNDKVSTNEIFARVRKVAHHLEFENCAYGFRFPVPFTKPKVAKISDYPRTWCDRYDRAGYINIDPTVLHGKLSQSAIVWSDELFTNAKSLWEESKSYGLVVGWSKSTHEQAGGGGMLTLVRSGKPLGASELEAKELSMRRLADVAHAALSHVYRSRATFHILEKLSAREIDILRWHADGKTALEIGEILHISIDTVKYHTKNAVMKLGSANKTAAVVRAAVLGFL